MRISKSVCKDKEEQDRGEAGRYDTFLFLLIMYQLALFVLLTVKVEI